MNVIESLISQEDKLALAKQFSNLFFPTAPFDKVTCRFMYKENQIAFNAYVLGYKHSQDGIKAQRLLDTTTTTTHEVSIEKKVDALLNRIISLENTIYNN